MEFQKVIETKDGAVKIEAEFDKEEVEFLISYAVTSLIRSGAMPLVDIPTETAH